LPYLPTKVITPDGYEARTEYDQFGNIILSTNFHKTNSGGDRVITTTYCFSYGDMNFPLGRLDAITDSGNSGTITLGYESLYGMLKSITKPRPGSSNVTTTTTTTFTYDFEMAGEGALGNIVKVEEPGTTDNSFVVVSFSYTSDGSGYTQAPAIGQALRAQLLGTDTQPVMQERFRYEREKGILKKILDNHDKETEAFFNTYDRLLYTLLPSYETNPALREKIEIGRLYPGGPINETRIYDKDGNQVGGSKPLVGASGETQEPRTYNPATSTYETSLRMARNPAQQVIGLQDAAGQTTTYVYEDTQSGLLQTMAYPLGDYTMVTQRGDDGHPTQWQTRTAGGAPEQTVTVSDSTDPEGLLTSLTINGITLTNSYTALGQLLTHTDQVGSETFSYYATGEVSAVETVYTGLPAKTVGYEYHQNSSLKKLTLVGQGDFVYAYDAAGRLSTITAPGPAGTRRSAHPRDAEALHAAGERAEQADRPPAAGDTDGGGRVGGGQAVRLSCLTALLDQVQAEEAVIVRELRDQVETLTRRSRC